MVWIPFSWNEKINLKRLSKTIILE